MGPSAVTERSGYTASSAVAPEARPDEAPNVAQSGSTSQQWCVGNCAWCSVFATRRGCRRGHGWRPGRGQLLRDPDRARDRRRAANWTTVRRSARRPWRAAPSPWPALAGRRDRTEQRRRQGQRSASGARASDAGHAHEGLAPFPNSPYSELESCRRVHARTPFAPRDAPVFFLPRRDSREVRAAGGWPPSAGRLPTDPSTGRVVTSSRTARIEGSTL